MRCPEAQALLEAYVDDVLSPSQREAVDAHVAACAACRAELASWRQALCGLELAVTDGAPDLWSRFQERVRVEQAPLSCVEALELVPGLNDAQLSPREATDLAGHLAACTVCREEEDRLAVAVRTLEAVAASTPAPDLWPAFVSRLERERAARPAWLGWLDAARRSIAVPRAGWLRPAMALGGVALAALLVFGRQPSRPFTKSARNVAPDFTTALPPPPPAVTPKRHVEHPVQPTLSPSFRTADAPIIRPRLRSEHSRRRDSGWRLAKDQRPHPSFVRVRVAPRQAQLALNNSVREVEGAATPHWQAGTSPTDAGTVTEAAQTEVVHAVEMLAGLEDTARRPFEMIEDGH